MKQSIFIALLLSIAISCFAQDPDNSKKNILSKNETLSKAGSSTIRSSSDQLPIDSDNYSIKRSNIGVGGFSGIITSGEGEFQISQSIGQSSVIGTFANSDYVLIQGFQEPFGLFDNLLIPDQEKLKARIYPNPFYHSVNVQVDEPFDGDVFIVLYDIKGRIHYIDRKPASQLILLHLGALPEGHYFIKVSAGSKQFTTNLIKQ